MDKPYDSDALKMGQIVYTANSKKDDDFWDDQELIDHWEATKELYKKQYSKFKKEDSPPPFNTEKRFQKRKISEKQKPMPKKKKSNQVKNEFIYNHIPPPQSIPLPQSIPPPQSILSYSFPYFNQQQNDASITQLIHAWYLYGYYNGYIEGKSRKSTNS
ncbi:unnamed protein product [Cunninghamella blakesleeana]